MITMMIIILIVIIRTVILVGLPKHGDVVADLLCLGQCEGHLTLRSVMRLYVYIYIYIYIYRERERLYVYIYIYIYTWLCFFLPPTCTSAGLPVATAPRRLVAVCLCEPNDWQIDRRMEEQHKKK